MTITYSGVPGSYAEEAAIGYFGQDKDFLTAPSFSGALDFIRDGQAQFAVLPIENSSTGGINAVYDLLGQYGFSIVGEQYVKVEHCLLMKPGGDLSRVSSVYSHEQGIYQCQDFLSAHPDWKAIPMYNTAAAAKMVAEAEDPTLAAIASRRAAQVYGLSVLAEKINSRDENCTRFLVIGESPQRPLDSDKISIAFTLPHVSGSLCRVLEIFSARALNLVKIESRPISGKNWEYLFFLDFVTSRPGEEIESLLTEVSAHTQTLRVLGYYRHKEP